MSTRSLRPWACALLAASLFAMPGSAAPAKKKGKKVDSAAPVITHTPPAQHDGALVLEATIVDESGVFDPAVLVRAPGGTFDRVPLVPVEGSPTSFRAEVPTSFLGGDLEYLIEAFDENGNGPARAGDEATPLRVVRIAAPPKLVEAPPDVTPPPPPPEEDNGLLIGAGIAVGSVVLLGAAAGIGFAVYALRPAGPENVTVTISGNTPIAGAAP